MTLLYRKRSLRVKKETTKGTAITPTDECLQVQDLVMNPDDTMLTGGEAGSSMSPDKGVVGMRTGTCSFRAEMRGDGTSALDDALEVLMECCGWTLATLTYTPSATVAAQSTCTIDVFEDGLHKRMIGCHGDARIGGDAGGQAFMTFTMRGVWVAPVDLALPTPTISAQPPLRMAGATFTLPAGITPSVSRFECGLNAVVTPHENLTSTGGVQNFDSTGRSPDVMWDPEAALVATDDVPGKWLAGTTFALSLLLTDGTVNVTITAPAIQIITWTEKDRDGKFAYDIVGRCLRSAALGNDELQIVTAAVI